MQENTLKMLLRQQQKNQLLSFLKSSFSVWHFESFCSPEAITDFLSVETVNHTLRFDF